MTRDAFLTGWTKSDADAMLAAAQASADRAFARFVSGATKTSAGATRTARALDAAQGDYDRFMYRTDPDYNGTGR